jgi:hypothetical protein
MLREHSLNTKARLSTERVELITDFHRRIRGVSALVRRTLAFKYLMENKMICINDGELMNCRRIGPLRGLGFDFLDIPGSGSVYFSSRHAGSRVHCKATLHIRLA